MVFYFPGYTNTQVAIAAAYAFPVSQKTGHKIHQKSDRMSTNEKPCGKTKRTTPHLISLKMTINTQKNIHGDENKTNIGFMFYDAGHFLAHC